MALQIEVTDKGREALRDVLTHGTYAAIVVGQFKASSDWYGTGATEAARRAAFQASTLTPEKYIAKVAPDGNSVSFFSELYPPAETVAPMAAVGLYFILLSAADVTYYDANPTINPADTITFDADHIFGLCWFPTSAEAIPAGIMQQIIATFMFSNGDVAGALYYFQPNSEIDTDQTDAINAMAASLANSIHLLSVKISALTKEIDVIKTHIGL